MCVKFFNKNSVINNLRGVTLLLGMLIMASILTVSLATSQLVINEIQQSAQLDKAIVAFYAAESGIERGLYQARQEDFDPTVFNQLSQTLANSAAYQLIASDTEEALYANLNEDESYQVDLYNPNSLDALTNPVKSLRIQWQGVGSWLEISWSDWTSAGTIENHQSVYISQVSSPYFLSLYDANVHLYRVRLIARQAPVTNLQINAYDNVNPPANCAPISVCQTVIPARVSLKSVGEYPEGNARASRQAIQVTMPEKSPVAGLYDYVLYSEAPVQKEN